MKTQARRCLDILDRQMKVIEKNLNQMRQFRICDFEFNDFKKYCALSDYFWGLRASVSTMSAMYSLNYGHFMSLSYRVASFYAECMAFWLEGVTFINHRNDDLEEIEEMEECEGTAEEGWSE